MFNPLRLYNYLRNRHWKEGIPETSLKEWSSMNRSQYTLTDGDHDDFQAISDSLQIDIKLFNSPQITPHQEIDMLNKNKCEEGEVLKENKFTAIPSVKTDWSNFRKWVLDKVIVLEKILDINDIAINDVIGKDISLEQFKGSLELKLNHIFFEKWIELYKIDDKFRFLLRFIATLSNLHDRLYGEDKTKDMPIKIKNLKFGVSLEKKLREINRVRNDISHKGMKEEEINLLLEHTFSKIKETYFSLLVQLANKQILSVVKRNKIENASDYAERARDFIIKTYFTAFSPSDMKRIMAIL